VYGAAKIGLITALILIALAILYPLVVFFIELTQNPNTLTLSVESTFYMRDEGKVVVKLKLTYEGSIPLSEFKLTIYHTTLDFGTVEKGVYEKELVVPADVVEHEPLMYHISFKIAGLYSISVERLG